jgi:hypothetical protein
VRSVRISLKGLTVPASGMGAEARVAGEQLLDLARSGFMGGFFAGCMVASAVAIVAAVLALVYLPAHPSEPAS